MDIFESLENLNVSEACFDEIMGIVEEILNERSVNDVKWAAGNSVPVRQDVRDDSHWANDSNRLKKAVKLEKELPNSKRDIKTLVNAARNVLKDRKEKVDKAGGILLPNSAPENKRYQRARLIASIGKGGGISPLIKNDSRPDEKTRKLDAKSNEASRKLRVKYNNIYYKDN